jgi:hypothetical protein
MKTPGCDVAAKELKSSELFSIIESKFPVKELIEASVRLTPH